LGFLRKRLTGGEDRGGLRSGGRNGGGTEGRFRREVVLDRPKGG
jgi:hypothetical protein